MRSVAIFGILTCCLSLQNGYSRSDTQFDFRSRSFDDRQVIKLEGEWEFYWNKLLEPEDFKSPREHELIQVPGSWNLVKDYPEKGYATYRTRIRLAQIQELAIKTTGLFSSSRLFVDGKLVATQGRVSAKDNPQSYEPGVGNNFVRFTPRAKDFDIVIQIANFDIFLGGIATAAPLIGSPKALSALTQKESALNFFIIGSLFIMGIYHICLWLLRRSERSPAYFGAFCLVISVYLLAGNGEAIALVAPGLGYTGYLRTYNTWILAGPLFAWFLYELYPNLFSRRFVRFLFYTVFPFYTYILFSEPRDFVEKTLLIQLLTAVLSIYGIYVLIKAIKSRQEGALIFFSGTLIIIFSAIHDMMMARGFFESYPIAGIGTFLFIFCQSILLARKFSKAFHRVEVSEIEIRKLSEDLRIERDQVLALNQNLEAMVDEKTREIRSIMTHIQLGIFTLEYPNFSIHKDYSKHLEELFETSEIAEKNGLELLFQNTNLSTDEKSQALSAMESCLGEASFTWETNLHCIPKEFSYTKKSGIQRMLEIDWNPIISDDDRIERILVTVKDVTELKALEAEAKDKKEELEFIGELLNVSPENFQRFLDTSYEFLCENKKLLSLAEVDRKDLELIKLLFINMHTMKGSARSLYLKHMTKIFHDVEQYYAQLQKEEHTPWNIIKMKDDLRKAEEVLDVYAKINSNKLGRSKQASTGIQLEPTHVQSIFNYLNQRKDLGDEREDLHLALHNSHSLLLSKLYKPAFDLFTEICLSVPTLAKDLGKADPTIDIDKAELFFNQKGVELMHKVFVHILRNSLDHGIETAHQRISNSKPERGRLSINFDSHTSKIHFKDDGKGLDLDRIFAFARDKNLVTQNDKLSNLEIAEMIFNSGLSTANSVSDISGRGVGMDAVRRYLRQAGADIQIRLLARNIHSTGNCYNFEFIIELPETLIFTPDKNSSYPVAS